MTVKLFIPAIFVLLQSGIFNPEITEMMVREAEEARYEAIINADTTALARFLAEEFVYHQPTGVIATKTEYLKNTSDGNPVITSAVFRDMSVNVYDGFAISRGTVVVEARLGENEISAGLLFLNVWILRDGRLQLLARQSAFKEN